MSQTATAPLDINERPGDYVSLPIAAATKIWAGEIIAVNTSGFATFAQDASGLLVVGRAEATVDNTADQTGGALSIKLKIGAFQYKNAASGGFTAASQPGTWAYVSDDQTVAASGTTHSIKAGVFIAFVAANNTVWIDTRAAFYQG